VYGVPVGTYANKQSPLGVSVGEYHFELQCTWCIRRGRTGVSGVAVVAYDFELRQIMLCAYCLESSTADSMRL